MNTQLTETELRAAHAPLLGMPDYELRHIPRPVRPTEQERIQYLASLPFAERVRVIKAEFETVELPTADPDAP
jgi:hypothetical protein